MKKLKHVVKLLKAVFPKPWIKLLITLFFLVSVSLSSLAWGFWAHKKINYCAVFTLPAPLFYFYKRNITYIEDHAVDPDKRRYILKEEGARHYIDLDHYCTLPCDELPRYWFEAIDSFTEDTLMKYGIVPYHINFLSYQLENAFKEKDHNAILKISADLGHYIADAHVPLHTTKNYNGQLSGQRGIHGFWESRLPELFGEDYDYFTGRAVYIDKPIELIWKFVLDSHKAVDSVLSFEAQLNEHFPDDRKYTYQERGQTMMKAYSLEYSKAYNELLDNMVERRMRRSIIDVGSIWFTCWVNAGKPDLSGSDTIAIADSIIQMTDDIKGRDHAISGFE
ncbi:MAG: S1/P1 Nuclease [Chitinophagales bacterium]|nr:S1/P1 Nuclease [Chitinophagales bacterium]